MSTSTGPVPAEQTTLVADYPKGKAADALYDLPVDSPDEHSEFEDAVTARVLYCRNTAQAVSGLERSKQHRYAMRMFGDDLPATENDVEVVSKIAYPFLGRDARKIREAVMQALIQDPQTYDSIELEPGDSTDTANAMVKQRAAVLLTSLFRAALRDSNLYSVVGDAFEQAVVMGTNIVFTGWAVDSELSRTDPMLLAAGIASGEDTSATSVRPTRRLDFRLTDIRNVFPPTLREGRGLTYLPWLCMHGTTRYRDMMAREVERKEDGSYCGSYANLDKLSPGGESQSVIEVWWGRADAVVPETWGLDWGRTLRAQAYPGFNSTVYVGEWHWEDAFPDRHKRPTSDQFKAFLRKFGNDPDTSLSARWWVVEVVDGVLVRFQPHPYRNGSVCPFDSWRFLVRPSSTYGASIYKEMNGCEEMFNWNIQRLADATERSVSPMYGVDFTMLDNDKTNIDDGVLQYTPDGFVYLRGGMKMNDALQPLLPAPGALSACESGIRIFGDLMQRMDNVTETMKGETNGGTATNNVLANQGAQVFIESIVTRMECEFLIPLLERALHMVITKVQEENEGGIPVTLNSPEDADALRGLDSNVDSKLYLNKIGDPLQGAFPMVVMLSPEDIEGLFRIRVLSANAKGGKQAKVGAMKEALASMIQLAPIMQAMGMPLPDFNGVIQDIMRQSGIRAPERFFAQSAPQPQPNPAMMEGGSQLTPGAPAPISGLPSPPAPDRSWAATI